MASLRRSRLAHPGLQHAAPPRPERAWRRRPVAALLVAVLLALILAWYEGGEEPLHPIAQPVALPGQSQ